MSTLRSRAPHLSLLRCAPLALVMWVCCFAPLPAFADVCSATIAGTTCGTGTFASGLGGSAFGYQAKANALSTALGYNAFAYASDSIALGVSSYTDRGKTVSVGAAGQERQIVNVAAATMHTDAAILSS